MLFQAVYEFVGLDMFQFFGKFVHFLPAKAQILYKETLPDPVLTDHLQRSHAAAGGEQHASGFFVGDEPFACQALDLFEHDWRELVVVELLEEFQPLIRQLAARHGLKGADLVHLASAIWIGKSLDRPVTFVGSDARLQRAAALEKLRAVNPED